MMRTFRSFAAASLMCVTTAAYPTYASPCVVSADDGIAQTSRSAAKGEAHDITLTPLEVGKPIERQIGGGQTHRYSIRLEAGQLLDATVEQKDVDVAVVLLGPSGETVLEVDSPNGTNGPEPVLVIAVSSGNYTLDVKTLDPADKGGRYEARVNELRLATEKDRQLEEAMRLSGQSVLLAGAGKIREALELAERAAPLYEKALGPEHPDMATSLINLTHLYISQGQYAKAETLTLRVLAIREKALGPDHPRTAVVLGNLAEIYRLQGQYAKAEPLGLRALEINEKALGPQHPDVAVWLNNLAALYCSQGQYAKAEPLFLRALAIREKALGPEHPHTAFSLIPLAAFYGSQGQYAKAEPLFLRALAINEKALGPEHPDTALLLNSLALLYRRLGQDAKAESLFVRALAINEKSLGPEHSYTALLLGNLADLYSNDGQYARAEPLYLRAYAIYEKALGPEHRKTVLSLNALGMLYTATQDYPRAISTQARANEFRERDLLRNLASGSEREKLLYLQLSSGELDRTLSLHIQRAPSDATARRIALEIILRRKGRALDAMTDAIAALRRRASPDDAALLGQLTQTRAELSRRTLAGQAAKESMRTEPSLRALRSVLRASKVRSPYAAPNFALSRYRSRSKVSSARSRPVRCLSNSHRISRTTRIHESRVSVATRSTRWGLRASLSGQTSAKPST